MNFTKEYYQNRRDRIFNDLFTGGIKKGLDKDFTKQLKTEKVGKNSIRYNYF